MPSDSPAALTASFRALENYRLTATAPFPMLYRSGYLTRWDGCTGNFTDLSSDLKRKLCYTVCRQQKRKRRQRGRFWGAAAGPGENSVQWRKWKGIVSLMSSVRCSDCMRRAEKV